MNQPEYILTDEMEIIVAAVKVALNIPVLNFQYGYIEELNETLKQFELDPSKYDKKFPLVWLAEPFTTVHNSDAYYGEADPDIFIINATEKTYKAKERMTVNYLPVLYPIRQEFLNQISISQVFQHPTVSSIQHSTTKGYYWGEGQKSVLNDTVDCLKLGKVKLKISNKQNCNIFSNI